MARLIKPAARVGQKARIALAAPAKAGKTWTALQWAEVLEDLDIKAGGPGGILGIDTERGEMGLYADKFTQANGQPFDHMQWDPPYSPEELGREIAEHSPNYSVILIDSGSHFWRGEGGVLDIVDQSSGDYGGNKFAGWKEGTGAQDDMVDAITRAQCHVIFTMRSKMTTVLEEGADGKKTPVKKGLQPIQRDDMEYEFTVIASLDTDHNLRIDGTRCDLLDGKTFAKGKTIEAAEILGEWLLTADPLISRAQIDELNAAVNAQPVALIAPCRAAVRQTFGQPTRLVAAEFPKVMAFVSNWQPPGAVLDGPDEYDGMSPDEIAAKAAAEAKAEEPAPEPEAEPPAPSPEELEAAADEMRAEKSTPRGAKKATAKKATAKKSTKKGTAKKAATKKTAKPKAPRDKPIPDEGEPWDMDAPTPEKAPADAQDGSMSEEAAEVLRQSMQSDWARLGGDDAEKAKVMLGQFDMWPIGEIEAKDLEQADSILSAVIEVAGEIKAS